MTQQTSTSFDDIIRQGAAQLTNSDTPMLDARVLMMSASGFDTAGLIAAGNDEPASAVCERFLIMIARRSKGEPIAYIVGEKEFWGLSFQVRPGVLIPRPDSECLVETAIRLMAGREKPTILDLGVGSGCLITTLLTELPTARGMGIDQSTIALDCARENAERHGISDRCNFVAGDWATGLNAQFDLIIANPPYIPTGDKANLAVDVRDHEPPRALFSGNDGLNDYRTIISQISALLMADGIFIGEAGDSAQIAEIAALARAEMSDCDTFVIEDLAKRERGIAIMRSGIEKD